MYRRYSQATSGGYQLQFERMNHHQRSKSQVVWTTMVDPSRQNRKPHVARQCLIYDLGFISRYGFSRLTPSFSAILTKSANDLVPIFFMIRPRCIFTVIS